jgi:hypothetical protein
MREYTVDQALQNNATRKSYHVQAIFHSLHPSIRLSAKRRRTGWRTDFARAGGLSIDGVVSSGFSQTIKLQAPHGIDRAEFCCICTGHTEWTVFTIIHVPWYLRLARRKLVSRQKQIMDKALRKVLPEMLASGYVMWEQT